jgi:hypothetical protein
VVTSKVEEQRCLGQRDDWPHRLGIYETDDPAVAHLRRYRLAADPPYDVVAEIEHAGGVVSKFSWDDRHQVKNLSTWRADVEGWIKARVAADRSKR